MNKDVKKIKKYMLNKGWEIKQGRNNHMVCFHPSNGGIITLPSTPANPFNFRFDFKRNLRKINCSNIFDEIF